MLNELAESYFDGGSRKFACVNTSNRKRISKPDNCSVVLDKILLKNFLKAVKYVLDNCLFLTWIKSFQQVIGIPMGPHLTSFSFLLRRKMDTKNKAEIPDSNQEI